MGITPGKWSVERDGSLCMGGQVVATRLAPDGATRDEQTANARLCASAPELAAALENARVALRFYRKWMVREATPPTDYPFGKRCEEDALSILGKAGCL